MYYITVIKKLFLFPVIVLLASVSCTKEDLDAIDSVKVEGCWKVESIRYEGTLADGTEVRGEPEHCDIFWTGDIVEFKSGSVFLGEKGDSFYSYFNGYPGSIAYSIVERKLFIPEQTFPSYEVDAGGGWTVTIAVSVGEWSLPYAISNDTWIIRHEHRAWFEMEYKDFYSVSAAVSLRQKKLSTIYSRQKNWRSIRDNLCNS